MATDTTKKAWAFEDLLIAAMLDAAIERKLTQLKAVITPQKTGKTTHVRIIVIPEEMSVEVPEGFQSDRSPTKKPGGH